MSLNIRGIRAFEKRKPVFSWLVNSDADIFFLQETYSTRDIEISGESNGKAKCSSRCLVPRLLSFDENVRAEEDGKETAVCTLAMVSCGSLPVARLYLAKNEAPEEAVLLAWQRS